MQSVYYRSKCLAHTFTGGERMCISANYIISLRIRYNISVDFPRAISLVVNPQIFTTI